jgi:hypothetical protein
MGQPAPSPAPQTQTPAGTPVIPVDPVAAGAWLAGIGVIGFVLCRVVLSRHWKKIKADPKAHPFGAIWTDVLIRLVSYVCMLLMALGVFILIARLSGRI